MASEPLFVDPEVIVDIGTDVTLAFPGGFLAGAAAVDASGGFEGLAARGPPVADMAAGADLVVAGSQALVTKFHGISPALKMRILEYIRVAYFCQETSGNIFHQEGYISEGIDNAHKPHHDGIELSSRLIICGKVELHLMKEEYDCPSGYDYSGKEKESCCVRNQKTPRTMRITFWRV
jgi:hypothetical protein